MDLELSIVDNLGRPADALAALEVYEVVPLQPGDFLDDLDGEAVPRLTKVRQSHHEIARLTAAGLKGVEIARLTGKSPQTIYNLGKSPAFKELVAYYQTTRDEEVFEMMSRLKMLASDLVEELEERINDPEKVGEIPTKDIASIASNLLDRTGHGPTRRQETVNLNVTGEDLRAIKAEAQGQKAKVIEGEATEVD